MTESAEPTGKGRPTPKRRDVEHRRGGPVAPPPANRKEAARRVRQQGALQRKAVREGTKTGDESRMMARDRGPVRRLVRDVVDGRRHVGVLLLPAAVLPVLAQLTGSSRLLAMATTLWLATLLAAVSDFVITAFLVRQKVRAAFPEEPKLLGHVGYAVVRTAQFRRFRLPPPRVRPGDPIG